MTFQNLLIKRYQGDSVWFILNQADDTFVAFKSFPNVDAAIGVVRFPLPGSGNLHARQFQGWCGMMDPTRLSPRGQIRKIFANACYSLPVDKGNDQTSLYAHCVLISAFDYLHQGISPKPGTVERLTAYMERTGRW